MSKLPSTSWQRSGKWYNQTVGQEGHYYHQAVIFPQLFPLFSFTPTSSLLDLACGQGVLSRHPSFPSSVEYVGIDAARSLIEAAKRYPHPKHHRFLVGDVTAPLPVEKKDFTHATVILATQNIREPSALFANAAAHLQPGGRLFLVLNHPCFRIPRQSSWEVDTKKDCRYRRIDRYLSPMEIPIQMHPGKGEKSTSTLSFHRPLSEYSRLLKKAGFLIESIEEWCSDKESEGGAARRENRSRAEIPLFITIVAKK